MNEATVCVELQDGTGTYVTCVVTGNFDAASVARAAGEATAWFIDGYRRDQEERGAVWDPASRE